MSKLTGNVFVPKDRETRENVISSLKRVTPPGTTTTTNYSNQLYGSHNRSALVIGHARPKKALPYRVFAGKCDAFAYDFTYTIGTSLYRRWGKTPVAASVGAGVPLTWGTSLSGGLIVPAVSQNMINRATTEALNDLASNKANILATIIESKESIDLIVEIFSRIVRSLRAFKARRYGEAYRILTGKKLRGKDTRASRLWLTYQYALRPAMYDIFGLIDSVKGWTPPDPPVITGARFLVEDFGLPTHPFHYKTWEVAGSCKVGVEVVLKATIANHERFWLNSLAVYNPMLLAWELITLSFVIDWLIPIGNVLEALNAPIGLVFFDGYTNTKTVTDFTWHGVNVEFANGHLPGARITNVCQLRTPFVNFPLPGIYIKSPFSYNNLVSSLALLAVMRK